MRLLLFIAMCGCIAGVVYLGFFKNNGVEERLTAISKISNRASEESVNEAMARKKGFKFVKVPEAVRSTIVSSGIMVHVEEFVIIWITITFLPAFIFYLVTGNTMFAIVIAVAGAMAPILFINIKKKQRLDLFGVQLGDALLLISNGLRAGFSFEQVLETVSKELPDPISTEFGRVTREIKLGLTLEKSLNNLTERMENTDMRLLTSAVLIQRQVGGNLADILDNISTTIQDRIKIKNTIKTLSAQGRLSGIVVGAIPIVLFLAISAINPEYMSVFYTSTYGKIMMIVVVIMETLGFLMIRKLINIDA